MKKFVKFFTYIICLFFIFNLSACNFFEQEADPSTFDSYTQELFQIIMGDDELNSHFLFKHPENYGLSENGTIMLPTPATTSSFSKFIINLYFGDIKNYDYNKLSFDQQMTYNVITNLIDSINEETTEMSYLGNNYLGSYLGYQAQLPLLLSEYAFYDMDDINNYFAFIDLVPETFEAYVDFEIEKTNEGYGMPDFVISKVIDQCTEFINDIENHFLIKTFNSRIENLDFLTNSPSIKDELIQKNYEKVTGPLKDGYEYIKNNLGQLYGKATNNLGLYYYKEGKEYYSLLFKNETGYDIDIDDAIKYIESKLLSSYNQIIELLKNNPNLESSINNISLMTTTPQEQLETFKNNITGHFPTIDCYPNIHIKYIDKSMENHFSPAAYMTSPIDDFTNEYIYLNNASIDGDYNYLYHTLAHEGIPGHLYQNIYFKNLDTNIIRKVIKSSGYIEGWATYVEMYSFNFCQEENQQVAQYLKLNNEFSGALQCRLDMGIHYEGWDATDVYNYLNQYLSGYTMETATEILEQLIEIPTNSQIYFFTYFKIQDMYNRTKTALNNKFNEVNFHKLILDCGPVPLRYVEIVVDKYIQEQTK